MSREDEIWERRKEWLDGSTDAEEAVRLIRDDIPWLIDRNSLRHAIDVGGLDKPSF